MGSQDLNARFLGDGGTGGPDNAKRMLSSQNLTEGRVESTSDLRKSSVTNGYVAYNRNRATTPKN